MPTIWTPAAIRAKILSSDVMLERSIVKLYDKQTTSEQNIGATVEHNKVGFTAFDAEFLSDVARFIRASTFPEGRRLSVLQKTVARRKMVKYARQLAKMVVCQTCRGDGAIINDRMYEGPIPCPDCNGATL